MIVYLVCTVFVVFALVSRQDKGKARAVSQTDGAPQKAVPNKRPKPSIPGTQGIAGFFAGGSSTHAKHVGAPLPYACPVRTNVKGPAFLKTYLATSPWLKWGVHPLSTTTQKEDPTTEKVLHCADCIEKGKKVQKNGKANPFYFGYLEWKSRL
jgi:hypothetical protein